MKQCVLVILSIFALFACSADNRIHTYKENGIKKMSLFQTPGADLLHQNPEGPDLLALKVQTGYRYEEKANERPSVVLDIKIEKKIVQLSDSAVFIALDDENIQLLDSKGTYTIPENLWVPIVHSKKIGYQLNTKPDALVLKLNEKQKDQLTEFFTRAINRRDVLFPAIPAGKKKW